MLNIWFIGLDIITINSVSPPLGTPMPVIGYHYINEVLDNPFRISAITPARTQISAPAVEHVAKVGPRWMRPGGNLEIYVQDLSCVCDVLQ